MKAAASSLVLCSLLAGGMSVHASDSGRLISEVHVSPPFFAPSLGQKETVSLSVAKAGTVSVLVLDRDGYPVRNLMASKPVKAGKMTLTWDGKDDRGVIVADEAYSFKIDLKAGGKTETYFPANELGETLDAEIVYYDRPGGTLKYTLPKAARVHLQTGTGHYDPALKEFVGPVLYNIVDRQPRAAGSVVESWDGYDSSKTVFIANFPDFVTSIFAVALPKTSVIATGNRKTTFLEVAAKRTGTPLMTPHQGTDHEGGGHAHHAGLTALEDQAPSMRLDATGATWSTAEKAWIPAGNVLHATASLEGPTAIAFQKQPGKVLVFLDGKLSQDSLKPAQPLSFDVPLEGVAAGTHILAVNWVSAFGPTAVVARKILIGTPQTATKKDAR